MTTATRFDLDLALELTRELILDEVMCIEDAPLKTFVRVERFGVLLWNLRRLERYDDEVLEDENLATLKWVAESFAEGDGSGGGYLDEKGRALLASLEAE